jgi:hypothetical protein
MSYLVSQELDLDPWGVCTPPGTLDVPQMIPPMESSSIGLKMTISPNEELGWEGFPRSSLMLRLQPQMSFWKRCSLNGWMMHPTRFHHQNLMESVSI